MIILLKLYTLITFVLDNHVHERTPKSSLKSQPPLSFLKDAALNFYSFRLSLSMQSTITIWAWNVDDETQTWCLSFLAGRELHVSWGGSFLHGASSCLLNRFRGLLSSFLAGRRTLTAWNFPSLLEISLVTFPIFRTPCGKSSFESINLDEFWKLYF